MNNDRLYQYFMLGFFSFVAYIITSVLVSLTIMIYLGANSWLGILPGIVCYWIWHKTLWKWHKKTKRCFVDDVIVEGEGSPPRSGKVKPPPCPERRN